VDIQGCIYYTLEKLTCIVMYERIGCIIYSFEVVIVVNF
jgi:hypothetical protein